MIVRSSFDIVQEEMNQQFDLQVVSFARVLLLNSQQNLRLAGFEGDINAPTCRGETGWNLPNKRARPP